MSKTSGVFVWSIGVETKWNYHDGDDDGDDEDYTVAAPNFESACAKACRIALHPSRKFIEEPDEYNGLTTKTLQLPVSVEIIKVVRGEWLDG